MIKDKDSKVLFYCKKCLSYKPYYSDGKCPKCGRSMKLKKTEARSIVEK